jgi:hypothetical protein
MSGFDDLGNKWKFEEVLKSSKEPHHPHMIEITFKQRQLSIKG